MCNFELLKRETIAICEVNNVEFRWSELGFTDEYQFEFKKGNKGYTLTISKKDIFFKPFQELKDKVEYAINILLNTKI